MSDAITVSAPISGTDRTLTFEAGKLAQLADGAVVGRIGDTVLLATATAARSVREGADFFPLTVDIEERAYAAGKIPGSFFRREGKASDQAILTDRLIDRPLRPSFPKGFRNEVHIVGTVFGADQVNPARRAGHQLGLGRPHDLGHPLRRPHRCRAGRLLDRGHVDPAPDLRGGRRVDLRAGGGGPGPVGRRHDAEIAIMMVEAGGSEKSFQFYEEGAPKVTEEVLADGLEAAKTWIRESIVLQRQLVEAFVAARGPIQPIEYSVLVRLRRRRLGPGRGRGHRGGGQGRHHHGQGRAQRRPRRGHRLASSTSWPASSPSASGEIKAAVRALTKKLVRRRIVEEGLRIDGRTTTDIRPLSAEVDLFPTAHGSALFQRGETQVLNVTTLGMPRMNQLLDTITPERVQAVHAPLQLPALLDR